MKLSMFLGVLAVSGCGYFAPAYVQDADMRATNSFQGLSEMLAKAELGQYQSKSSFTGAVDQYAAVISQMETAAFALGGVAQPTRETPLARAKASQRAVVSICIQQMRALAEHHEKSGLGPANGALQGARISCDQAVKVIRATK